MAHLLEHMLFKGTPKYRNVLKLLDERGAQVNGTTWTDRTNYYETLPATPGEPRLRARARGGSHGQRADLAGRPQDRVLGRPQRVRDRRERSARRARGAISAIFDWWRQGDVLVLVQRIAPGLLDEYQQTRSAGLDGSGLAIVLRDVLRQQRVRLHELRLETRGIGKDDRDRLRGEARHGASLFRLRGITPEGNRALSGREAASGIHRNLGRLRRHEQVVIGTRALGDVSGRDQGPFRVVVGPLRGR